MRPAKPSVADTIPFRADADVSLALASSVTDAAAPVNAAFDCDTAEFISCRAAVTESIPL